MQPLSAKYPGYLFKIGSGGYCVVSRRNLSVVSVRYKIRVELGRIFYHSGALELIADCLRSASF